MIVMVFMLYIVVNEVDIVSSYAGGQLVQKQTGRAKITGSL